MNLITYLSDGRSTARVFTALALTLPPVAIYAPKGTVAAAALAAVLLLVDPDVRAVIRENSVPRIAWCAAPLLIWALIAAAWSPDPADAIVLWGALIILLAIGRVLAAGAGLIPEEARRPLAMTLIVGGAAFATVLLIENLNGGLLIEVLGRLKGLRGDDHIPALNPGNMILAVYAVPFSAAAAYRFNPIAGALAYALCLVVVANAPSSMPLFTSLVTATLFLAVRFGRKRAVTAFAAALVAGQAAIPFLVHFLGWSDTFRERIRFIELTWQHRWAIWEFVTARIFENPVLGWGLDSSRAIPGGDVLIMGQAETLPLHPHNGFLQVWLELGGIGALLSCVLLALAPAALARLAQGWMGAALVLAVIGAYFAPLQFSFGIWQNWWIATASLCAAFTFIFVRANTPRRASAARISESPT